MISLNILSTRRLNFGRRVHNTAFIRMFACGRQSVSLLLVAANTTTLVVDSFSRVSSPSVNATATMLGFRECATPV